MVTSNKSLKDTIQKIIDYNWRDELEDFQETYEVEIQSQDSLKAWIEICETNGWTDHIFYHLMVISEWFLN